MSIFSEKTLGEVVTFQRGFDITKKEQLPGDIPIISSSGIGSYHNQFKAEGPGVIIGRKGTLGTVHYTANNYWPHDTSLWVKDFKGNNPRFVYYFLQTLHLENFDTGSSNPTLNRNHIHKIKVLVPAKTIQDKIAAVLSTYDDLIENNDEKIELLEKMAEEIYREWFVRFRFPGYQKAKFEKGIPVGWRIVDLNDIATESSISCKLGEHLKGRNYLPLDVMGSKKFLPLSDYSYKDAKSSLITFEKGDFIFGAMRPYQHKVNIAPFNGITRTTCFVIRPKETYLYSYLYLSLYKESTIDYAMQISNGSDRPYTVWNRGLERMKVIRPPKEILVMFEDKVKPIFEKIVGFYQIQKELKQTKELLHPRLISGKLAVADLNIQFPPSMQEIKE